MNQKYKGNTQIVEIVSNWLFYPNWPKLYKNFNQLVKPLDTKLCDSVLDCSWVGKLQLSIYS